MKHYVFSLFLIVTALHSVCSQVILTPLASPETMIACGGAESYTLSVINSDNVAYNDLILSVQLPGGMEYVTGSVQGPLIEFDVSDSSEPQFQFPLLAPLSTQEVVINCIINCAFTNDTGPLYTLHVPAAPVSAQEQPLANFFFPEVVITDIDFPVLDLAVSGTGTRTFTVIQSTPGASLDTLFFINRYEPGMQSLGLNNGTLIGSSPGIDTFMITGADLPGGDNGFDEGDTLLLTETVSLLDCAPANSVIELYWRCGSVICQSFIANTILTQATGSPDLRIRNTNGFPNQVTANTPSLVGGGFCDTLELTYLLENLGQEDAPGAGAVYDLILGLGLNNNLFSSSLPFDLGIFPNWSITVTIGGNPVDLGTYHYPAPNPLLGYNLDFRALSSDPDGAGGLADVDGDGFFDDLPVGTSTELRVHIVYDPDATSGCAFLSGYPYNGGAETNFRLGYLYQDQCGEERNYWYSVNDPGINVVSLFTHRAIVYTVDIADNNLLPGQETTIEIRPDGAWNSPCASTDSFVLELILPDGLVAASSSYGPGAFDGIVGQSGDTVWLASDVRGTFTQPWGLNVILDCSEAIVDSTLDISFLYFCDTDCSPMKRINCQEIIMDYLPQCEDCLEGIETVGFTAERISLGWTNAAHTERIDPNTNSTYNLAAAINRDSVTLSIHGIVRGSASLNESFARVVYQGIDPAFADPTLPHFEPIGSSLEYYTIDGQSYFCQDAPISLGYDNSNGHQHAITAALESFFQAGGCLENVVATAGDSLVFHINTLVTENTPRRALPIPELKGQFYLIQNGQTINCNEYLDDFMLEEVIPNVNLAYATQEHYGCGDIYFNNNSIANPGHIYDADQFPNEVRSIVDVSEVRMLLEGNWEHIPGSSDLLANGSFDENDAVSVTAPFVTVPLPDPIISFDGQFTTFTYQNQGDWPKGDLVIGGSNPVHNIRFRARPGCLVPRGTPFTIEMQADMIRYLNAPVDRRDTITASTINANKTYLGPSADLLLASPQQFIPNSDTVRWEVDLNNTTSYGHPDKLVQHAWLAIDGAEAVDIFAIEDVSDPANPIPFFFDSYNAAGSYWVQIGDIEAFATMRIRISGLYRDCEAQSLQLSLGYSCIDYPNPNPGTGYLLAGTYFQCPVEELELFIQPTPVSLNLTIEGPPIPAPLCEVLDYSVVVTNVNLPTAYQHRLETRLPFGAEILSGSSQIEIPANSGNWFPLQDPSDIGDNRYSWDVSNDPNGTDQLLGVNRSPVNTYRLAFQLITRCGLNAGLRIGFRAHATNNCGETEEKAAFSERLLIEGLPEIINNYAIFLDVPEGGLQACDTSSVKVKLINLGPLPSRELEYAVVTVPAAFDFRPGSTIGLPTLTNNTGLQDSRLLQFQMPEGVAAGDSISFSFELTDLRTEELNCDEEEVSLAMFLESEVACSLSPTDSCAILLFLNADTITSPIQKDELEFEVVDHVSRPLGTDGESITSVLSLFNPGNVPARTDSIIWEVYVDENASGTLDDNIDMLLYSSPERPISLGPGAFITDSITYNALSEQICQLLITYRNTGYSCECEAPAVWVLPTPVLSNAGPNQVVCSDAGIWLGEDERQGNVDYEWTQLAGNPGTVLLQPDSASAYFLAPNDTENSQFYAYQLETSRGPNCISFDTVSIEVLPELRPAINITSDYNGQAISCAGAMDGALEILVGLATLPLQYELAGQAQDSPLYAGLASGQYEFDIIDGNGCETTISEYIPSPDSLTLEASIQAVSCFGGSDGQISLTAGGGTPGYFYSWNDGLAPEANNGNLSSGWYEVTLSDANDCMLSSDSLWLGSPEAISYEISIDSTSCDYSNDGGVVLDTLYGGTPSFQVLWSDGTSGLQNLQLETGNDTFLISDANNCLLSVPYSIPGPDPLVLSDQSQQNISCFGSTDGQLSIEISGGTGPYQYNWSNGHTGAAQLQLPSGDFQVMVTDAQNCEYLSPVFTITEPTPVSILNTEILHVSCFGFADGQLSVQASGGIGPYQYLWGQGQNGPIIDGLQAGNHPFQVVDSNGCMLESSLDILQPAPLQNVLERFDPACHGEPGLFLFYPEGGTPPYLYSLDNGQSYSDNAEIPASPGNYQILIQDSNGCEYQQTAEMVEPLPILLFTPEEIVLNYGDSLELFFPVYNVRGDTLVHWTPASNQLSCTDCLELTMHAFETTVFYLEVEDSYGCKTTARIPLIVERPRRVYIPTAFSPDGQGDNNIFYPFGAAEVAEILYLEIYNRWGSQVFVQKSFPPNDPTYGWDGTFDGSPLPSAVYVYQMMIRFTDGAILPYSGDIILLR